MEYEYPQTSRLKTEATKYSQVPGHVTNLSESNYRVTRVVAYQGWVDYDFAHCTVCPALLEQVGIWQNWL